jgi:hypothetical protein
VVPGNDSDRIGCPHPTLGLAASTDKLLSFHNRSLPERSRLTDKLCGVCSSVAN